MEIGQKAIDLVFVVGRLNSKTRRAISRYTHRVLRSSNGFRVASIYFTPKYDSNLSDNVFLSRTVDFTADVKSHPVKMNELPQVQGNPLQHLSKLSFRENAIKICFFLSNTPPFQDPYVTRQEKNDNGQARKEEIYHEDPLLTSRCLAAMGVALYCIQESNQCVSFYGDMYAAFSHITGGQLIVLDNITGLSKIIRSIILEEITLEQQVGQVKDCLCVAWHSWGRMKARVPANVDVLTDNILNHFHNTNVMTYEVLVGGNAPEMPSKLAKEIAKVSEVSEARSLRDKRDTQENWSAELNWISEELDEVIPGYKEVPHEKKSTELTVSKLKLVTRNQVSRILRRVLTRRPQNYSQLRDNPTLITLDTNNDKQQDTKQSNTSNVFTSSPDHKMDNNNKLLEETTLQTKSGCKPHETIVINCQKIALCSVA